MSQEIISRKTKTNLEALKKANLLKDFYLAGGTGLALQLKHRLSLDLDFFTPRKINTKRLIQGIKRLGKLAVEKETEDTLICQFNGTKLTFLRYDYPLLSSLKTIEGIRVAAVQDIACTKIDAISSRGTKRDFIDLFFICQKVARLERFLKLFEKKYQSVHYNKIHILKSLSYFEDAEREPMPKMIVPVSWKEIKNFFQKEIKKIK